MKHLKGKTLYITMVVLLVAGATLIGISGISRFKNGHGIDGVIGGIGWFGGLLLLLAFVILGVRALVLGARGRRATATT